MPKMKEKNAEIVTVTLQQGRMDVHILGQTPLIYNAMSYKSKMQLLMPSGRKTTAEKAVSLKHNPMEEYRDSVYRRMDGDKGPTRLIFPANAFKSALRNVASVMPGSKKTEINKLVYVNGATVDIYGVPQLLMSVVKSAGFPPVPDIRTRAILPQWACKISVTYCQPMLNANTMAQLLSAAGMLMGIGDFRQEKGAGNYGQFKIVESTDVNYKAVLAGGGMAAQDKALLKPVCHDQESIALLAGWQERFDKRDPERAKK